MHNKYSSKLFIFHISNILICNKQKYILAKSKYNKFIYVVH